MKGSVPDLVRGTTQQAKLHTRDDHQWAAVGRFATSRLIFYLDRIGVTCDTSSSATIHSTQHVDSDSKQATGCRHPWAQHAFESLFVFACCSEPHACTRLHADSERLSRRRCSDTVRPVRDQRHTRLCTRVCEEASPALGAEEELIAGR